MFINCSFKRVAEVIWFDLGKNHSMNARDWIVLMTNQSHFMAKIRYAKFLHSPFQGVNNIMRCVTALTSVDFGD